MLASLWFSWKRPTPHIWGVEKISTFHQKLATVDKAADVKNKGFWAGVEPSSAGHFAQNVSTAGYPADAKNCEFELLRNLP